MLTTHTTSQRAAELVAAYRVDAAGSCLWVGVSPLTGLGTFADARQRSEWLQIVTPDAALTLTVLGIGAADDMRAVADMWIGTLQPWCNLNGRDVPESPQPRRIVEPSTGAVWWSVADLVADLGVTRQAVSLHLTEQRKTLAGRVFKWDGAQ